MNKPKAAAVAIYQALKESLEASNKSSSQLNKLLGQNYQRQEQLIAAVYWFRRQMEDVGFIASDQAYIDLVNEIQRTTDNDFNGSIVAANNHVSQELVKHRSSLAAVNGTLYIPNFKLKK